MCRAANATAIAKFNVAIGGWPAMDAPLPQRRWLRLQFGLRSALVLMTLAAIGVAMWTRWPYAVDEKVAQTLWLEVVGRRPGYATGAYNTWTITATRESAHYRRLLGGQRVRHGESQLFVTNGDRVVQRHFRDGILHGDYREWYATGGPRTEGQYNRGRKHGQWLLLARAKLEEAANDYRRTQNWNLGVPHGEWKWEDGYGTVYLHVLYDTGRVTAINGEPVTDYFDDICRSLPTGPIPDHWRVFHRYQAQGGYPDWMGDPLAPVPSIRTEYDPRLPKVQHERDPNLPWEIPYAVSLAIKLRETNCAATRRFDCLYITRPELLAPEHDLTGVSSLLPPLDTVAGVLLAKNIKVTGNEINYNFRQALLHLQNQVGLPIDVSALDGTLEPRDEDRSWITLGWNSGEHNVRDLLGLALHRARCRCELINGVLVIKRQEP